MRAGSAQRSSIPLRQAVASVSREPVVLPGEESRSWQPPETPLQHRQCCDSGMLRLPLSDQTLAGCELSRPAEAPGAASTRQRLDQSPGSQIVPGPKSQFPVGKAPGAPREGKKLLRE